MSLSHMSVSFIKLENDMHTCIFLRGIKRINPHGDAVNRNNFAPLYFIQYVSWNVLAPSDLVLHIVMFLTMYL